MVTAQYAGWSNPPATRFDAGLYLAPSPDGKWRISADPAAVDGAEVETQTIKHAAIPYHPATAGHPIAGQNYRDFALPVKQATGNPVAINASLPTDGNLALQTGQYVAGVPVHYTWLRQLPPPMSAGEMPQKITVDVTIEVSTGPNESYSNQYVCLRSLKYDVQTNGFTREDKQYNDESGETKTTQKFSATVSADAWMRTNATLLMGVIGAIFGDSAAMKYSGSMYNYRTWGEKWTIPEGTEGVETTYNTDSEETPTGSGTQSGRMLMVCASGRNETDATVGLYVAGMASASGSVPTSAHTTNFDASTRWAWNGSIIEEHHTEGTNESDAGPYARYIGASTVSPIPRRCAMADLIFDGLSIETVSASFNGVCEVSKSWWSPGSNPGSTIADSEVESTRTTVVVTHEHTLYSGENLPPGVTSTGWTHIVKTVNGVVSDDWYSDGDGSLYYAARVDYGNHFDFEDVNLPPSNEHWWRGSRYAWRNESITKRTEKFTVGE
jgi:hypothetical protein